MVSFENFPIFSSLLFLLSPSPLSFSFMISSFNTAFHSPCSSHQKKVMFLLRRIPFSTPHTPARRKGSLTEPSSGLTWLWLVATTYQAFFQKSYCFCLSKFKVLLYSLFIMFGKLNILSSTLMVLIIQNGNENNHMWKLFLEIVRKI